METMGQRIRALRKAAHLSQVSLAKTLGLDQSTVSDIENDKNDAFTGKVLLKMSETFSRSPFYIVYGVEGDGRHLSAEEAELLLAFRNAHRDQKQALLTLARALSQASGPPAAPH